MKSFDVVAAASAWFVLASSASAAPVTLTFEGVPDLQTVGSFYSASGITFNSTAVGLVSTDSGGSGNFENEPSPSTVILNIGGPAILTSSDGFDTLLSFYYSAAVTGSVSIYDDVGGLGNRLATSALSAQSASGCPPAATEPFCNWTQVAITFAGLGRSVVFNGGGQTLFDNVTLNAVTVPPGGVPEPTTVPLVLAALGTLVVASRRRRS